MSYLKRLYREFLLRKILDAFYFSEGSKGKEPLQILVMAERLGLLHLGTRSRSPHDDKNKKDLS